ncbi:MAG: PAS domain-containing protein [Alphaproteobacteria bacterium]|nr:PAS domain-containing protein [Alphaproteobacteria bacterium]
MSADPGSKGMDWWQLLDHFNSVYTFISTGGGVLAGALGAWVTRMLFADKKTGDELLRTTREIRDSLQVTNRRLASYVAMTLDIYSDNKVPIMRMDDGGQVNFVNAALTSLMDRPADALMGSGWESFVHVDDRALVQREIQAAVDTKRIYQGTFRLRTHGNHCVPVTLELRPLKCDDKLTTGYVGRFTANGEPDLSGH